MSACLQEVVFARPAELERLEALVRMRVGRRIREFRILCDVGGIMLRGGPPPFTSSKSLSKP